MKRLIANLALTAAAFTLAFLLGEGAVRLLYKQDSILFPRYHTDYHYGRYAIRGIRPNADFWHTSADGSWHFVTNSKGFRDTREFAYAKPPGTLRILVLGDSHTQGYEVRQDATYAAVAERFLSYRGTRAEAINAGVSGYSTAEALVFLENEGYKYHPDVVVLGFYANDFEDNLKAGLFALEGDQPAERRTAHLPGVSIQNAIYSLAPVRWLSENSYFYSLLFNGVWENAKVWLARAAVRDAAAGGTAPPPPEYAVAGTENLSASQVALAAALLERMQRFCAERGIRLIVADIPTRGEPHRFGSSLPPALRARLDAAGIEYLPSEAVLAAADGAAEFHVAHGHHHISEFTHALIGVEIGRRLLPPRR
jgi:GDSL-like lipase/acylhydrolase family protein